MFKASVQTYIYAFLIFCVLSSKSIIIYNEETLITASFGLFVFFVWRYFGHTVQESLDERSESIRVECQDFLLAQQQSLEKLAGEHEKIGQLQSALSQLTHFTRETIRQLTKSGAQSLGNAFSQQIVQKCGELLVQPGGQVQQKLQSFLARNQLHCVLVHCAKQERQESNNLHSAVLKNALKLFISAVKKNANTMKPL